MEKTNIGVERIENSDLKLEVELLKRRVSEMEAEIREMDEKPATQNKGILGWKYTAEEMALECGMSADRIRNLSIAGYAPCMLNEEGDIPHRYHRFRVPLLAPSTAFFLLGLFFCIFAIGDLWSWAYTVSRKSS